LERVATGVVAGEAAAVDRDGAFPGRSIAALAEAGLLGAASSTDVGGLGLGHRGAAKVVRRVARECGSTGMIACMHFSGTALIEALAPVEVRRDAASGRHLSTLAFSESGSRSHFWAPLGTASRTGNEILLNARKSWITSASHATAYLWSSRPVESAGLSTLWLVAADAEGLRVEGPFDGLGLRGNDSSPVTAENVRVPPSAMLTPDGGGFDAMLGIALPMFQISSAAFSVGLMEAAVERTAAHARRTRYEHLDSRLADLPTIRNYIARMKIQTDSTAALLEDTLAAVEAGRPEATLRVLECKAAGGEASTQVLDLAMRVCGGAAFRKEVGIERVFRDARASGVMGPTSDVLYDFVGKAVCGMELF
jgi:alkylation response protein AidB-like acyl-CoA dehydrogenase